MCAVAIASVLIGVIYFDFISAKIYEDSTDHLSEIYGQVNSAFGMFVERNWGLLVGWGDHLDLTSGDEAKAAAVIVAEELAAIIRDGK